MKDSAIYTMGSVSTTEIARAVCGLLSRFSDQSRTARELQGVTNGVAVMQHAVEHDLLRFEFLTHDDAHVAVEVDLRAMSRDYLDGLVDRVIQQLEEHRANKARGPMTDIAAGVSKVLH
jgi:hypothetical protein